MEHWNNGTGTMEQWNKVKRLQSNNGTIEQWNCKNVKM